RALIVGVDAVDGRADAMPFPEEWADAVTVAQAFHWFATEEALTEIHRVLKPGGGLGLIWNSRVRDDPVQARVDKLIDPLVGDVVRLYDDAWRRVIDASTLFGPLAEATFQHEQLLDEQGLVD